MLRCHLVPYVVGRVDFSLFSYNSTVLPPNIFHVLIACPLIVGFCMTVKKSLMALSQL